MIGYSSGEDSSSLRSVSFRTTHMKDLWILSTPSPSCDPTGIDMLLTAVMIAYQANLEFIIEPSPSSSRMEEEDPYVLPAWAVESSHTHDCLYSVFPSNEAIIEAISRVEPPWEELHH